MCFCWIERSSHSHSFLLLSTRISAFVDQYSQAGAAIQNLTFALSVANHAEAQRLKKMVVSGQQHAAELTELLPCEVSVTIAP